MATRKKPVTKGRAAEITTSHGVVTTPGLPDRVWASYGLTMNTGDFNSARIDSGMSSDVQEDESVEDAFLRIQSYCENEVGRIANDVRATLHGSPTPFKKQSAAKPRNSAW